jgi:opacity protein-like surface antigen
LTALPATTWAGNLTLRLGAFFPRADSDLFSDASELYTLDPLSGGRPPGLEASDWIGFTGGIEYNFVIARNVEFGFHVDGYGRRLDTSYRDYTRESDADILQTLELTTIPTGVTVRFVPTGRRGKIAPYVGGGVDAIYYEYEAYGDFIDFFDPRQPIYFDAFRSDGWAFGFHVLGGVRVPLGDDFSLVGEYRYQWSEDDMGGDFHLNRIDLSGGSATLGFNIRF